MRWFQGVLVSLLMMPFTVSASPYSASPSPELELPAPLGYVSDYAQILSPQWNDQIRAVCKDLELRTGAEMIVVAMPSAKPLSTASHYASKLYKQWRIGTAQQERGILLFVSVEERQAVVVLGRSLLSVISRDQLNQISEQFFVPMFRSSRYGENLYQASVRLASLSGNAPLPSGKSTKSSSKGFWLNLGAVFMMLYILWRFTRPERRHPFQRWRRGEYWGTGQGGFGGNFGGFGGGMSGQGLG